MGCVALNDAHQSMSQRSLDDIRRSWSLSDAPRGRTTFTAAQARDNAKGTTLAHACVEIPPTSLGDAMYPAHSLILVASIFAAQAGREQTSTQSGNASLEAKTLSRGTLSGKERR